MTDLTAADHNVAAVTMTADYGDGRQITVVIDVPAPAAGWSTPHPHTMRLAVDEAHAAIAAAITPRDADDLARRRHATTAKGTD